MTMREFREVIELDEAALRTLVTSGEPIERVWAAWALGLRDAEDLGSIAKQEPSPGVRRHLIVVLLGAHELGAVSAMLTHDPDVRVRATACLQLAQMLRPEDDALVDLLVSRARLDEAPVRVAFATAITEQRSERVQSLLVELLDDAETDVRLAAVDAWLRVPNPELDVLIARLGREEDELIEQTILRVLLDRMGVGSTFERIAHLSERVVSRAIELAGDRPIPREAVQALSVRHPTLLLRRLRFERVELTLETWVDLCVHNGQWQFEFRLGDALRRARPDEIAPLRDRLVGLEAEIELRALEKMGKVPDDATIEDLIDGIYELDEDLEWIDGISLLPQLRRLTQSLD